MLFSICSSLIPQYFLIKRQLNRNKYCIWS